MEKQNIPVNLILMHRKYPLPLSQKCNKCYVMEMQLQNFVVSIAYNLAGHLEFLRFTTKTSSFPFGTGSFMLLEFVSNSIPSSSPLNKRESSCKISVYFSSFKKENNPLDQDFMSSLTCKKNKNFYWIRKVIGITKNTITLVLTPSRLSDLFNDSLWRAYS